MRLYAKRDLAKDLEQYPSKSKRLLKALLSRRHYKKFADLQGKLARENFTR